MTQTVSGLVGGAVLAAALALTWPAAPVRAEPNIPDSEYVVVKDGHLYLRGERVRYWGAIGGFPGQAEPAGGDPYAAQRLLVQRIKDLGFNMVRLWHNGRALEEQDDKYAKGDLSALDRTDFFLTLLQKEGMKVWASGTPAWGYATPEDVGVIDDPATAREWKNAVAELVASDKKAAGKAASLRNSPAIMWDPRMEAINLRVFKRYADHVNQHNGLRWGDDPVHAVWELTNEQWMIRRMVGGGWQDLPEFFRRGLLKRWHEFLAGKYQDTAGLKSAWGALLPGEELEKGTILLAPLAKDAKVTHLNDTNPQALAAVQSKDNPFGPRDLPEARGRDVLEFFVGLHVAHKARMARAVKTMGKSCRLSPLVWDTGIGYEIQSQWMHQHADAVTHCAYVNGQYGHRTKEPVKPGEDELQQMQRELERSRQISNRGKWVSWLEKPPGISQGVPWLEHNRVEGQPYFAYETQIQQPAKYRADYPLRLGALAAIQDWDIVCWHTMGGIDKIASDPRPYDRPMDMSNPQHKPQGYTYRYDEVQNAMIRAAGWAFRHHAYQPAPNPTRFIFGRKALYDPISMRYAGSYGKLGMDMLPTTYQYGVRIRIDPAREDDQVIGPVVKAEDYETHNPYTPTDQIAFDWKKGFLMLDAPKSIAWTGLLAQYGDRVAFRNGAVLRDVTIRNAPGMFDPVGDDEKYLAFALYSEDGKDLPQAGKLALSLVSTSFNTGFVLDETGEYKHKRGTTPVLTARVGATFEWPGLDGLRYTLRDWHLKPIGQGVVRDGKLTVSADQPVFVVELTRP